MKIITKRIAMAGVATVFAASLAAGIKLLPERTTFVQAETRTNTAVYTYFHDNLTVGGKEYTLAKKFYKVFEDLAQNDELLDGQVEYNIIENGIVTNAQIKAWAENGDLTVPKAFSAARDAFLTDRPEIFYIDFYKLTISVGRVNGAYTATIDCGREANAYFDNGFTSPSEVSAAITAYNAEVDKIAKAALAAQAEDTYSAKDVFLARYVNKEIAKVTYDNEAYENRNETDASAAWESQSAYGALVKGKSVCAGYAKAYKSVMDKLEIPTIVVNGYGKNMNSNGEPGTSVYHAWNYVWLADVKNSKAAGNTAYAAADAAATNGSWYSVDATWNSSSANKNRYAILNGTQDGKYHDPEA